MGHLTSRNPCTLSAALTAGLRVVLVSAKGLIEENGAANQGVEFRQRGFRSTVYSRAKAVVVFVIGVLLSTWGYPANLTGASTECSVGSECTVQGELQIYRSLPTSTGVVRLETDCWLLALPMDVWLNYSSWNKKKVIVTGEAFSNLAASDVIWFEVRDRRVAVGICGSPIVIYVKSIRREP
jgi:hypothetical protein